MKHGYSFDKHYDIDKLEPKENPKFKPRVIGKYGIGLSPASRKGGVLVKEKPMSDVLKEQIRFVQFKQRRASKKTPSDVKIYKRVEKDCVKKLIRHLRSTQFKPHEPYKSIPAWTKNISPEFQEYLKDYRKERLIYLRKKYKEELKMAKKKKKKKDDIVEEKIEEEKKVTKKKAKKRVVGGKMVAYNKLTAKQKKRRDAYLKSKGKKVTKKKAKKEKVKKGKVIKRKIKGITKRRDAYLKSIGKKVIKRKVTKKGKVSKRKIVTGHRALPQVDKERYSGLVTKMSTDERKRKREIWRKRLASDSKSTRAKAKVYLSILGGKVSERPKKKKKKGKKIKM